jgi:hypothetical protein
VTGAVRITGESGAGVGALAAPSAVGLMYSRAMSSVPLPVPTISYPPTMKIGVLTSYSLEVSNWISNPEFFYTPIWNFSAPGVECGPCCRYSRVPSVVG